MAKKPKPQDDFIVAPLSATPDSDSISTLKRIGKKMVGGTIGDYTMGAVTESIVTSWNRILARRPRPDRLQLLIIKLVEQHSTLSRSQLLIELQRRKGDGVVEDYDDEELTFFTTDHCGPNGYDGPTDRARLTGLKDRLTRAKKEVRSR